MPGIALVASARRLEQRPVQGAPAQRSHGHQTETDAAGFFRLLALADGEYDVRTVATSATQWHKRCYGLASSRPSWFSKRGWSKRSTSTG